MKAQHLFSKLPAEIQFFLKKRLHVLNIYIFMRKCKCFFVRRHKISCFLKNNDFRVLHLGCGRYSIKKGEVFNSDLSFENFIDVLKPLPFPDNSIDVVFPITIFLVLQTQPSPFSHPFISSFNKSFGADIKKL